MDAWERARNRVEVFQRCLRIESDRDANTDNLAFLDRGIRHSPYHPEIRHYPTYLQQKLGDVSLDLNSVKYAHFSPYPHLGEIPKFDRKSLSFLHEEIDRACLCVGILRNGEIQTKWLGRNALIKSQCWSASKIIPVLNTIAKANTKYPDCNLYNCTIRDPNLKNKEVYFSDVVEDIVSYSGRISTSNALGAMLRRFTTCSELEEWIQSITGNDDLTFQGDYGDLPFIQNPELFDWNKHRVVLTAFLPTSQGDNLISTYDLTRLISMLGWHHHLEPSSRFSGIQWHSLECVVKALGTDTARYTDIALEILGLDRVVSSPAILSKLGNGVSAIRQTIEIVYTAFIQFLDERPKIEGKPAQLRSLAMTLRAVKKVADLGSCDREAIELDARMAAEVTEIIRRLFAEEFS